MVRFPSFIPLYRVNVAHMWMGDLYCVPLGSYVKLTCDRVTSRVGSTKCNPVSLATALENNWIVPFWKYRKVAPKRFIFSQHGNPDCRIWVDRQIITLGDPISKGWMERNNIERVDIEGGQSVYIRTGASEAELSNFYADKAKLLFDSPLPLTSDD